MGGCDIVAAVDMLCRVYRLCGVVMQKAKLAVSKEAAIGLVAEIGKIDSEMFCNAQSL